MRYLKNIFLFAVISVVILGMSRVPGVNSSGCDGDGGGGDDGPTFYPDEGSFFYGGNDVVLLDFNWTDPGSWGGAIQPAVEIDFNTYEGTSYSMVPYYGCTSTTSLPHGYDDCPTIGVSEDVGLGFGFGTFDARDVNPGYLYVGNIYLQPGGSYGYYNTYDEPISWNVTAAVLDAGACFENIWCLTLKTRPSKILISDIDTPDLTIEGDYYTTWPE